tara:strand:- start:220 stop:486 length:267 start_codon:yes stop_codon:yes gene_type:complete
MQDKSKPIYTNLSPEQRNTCVAAAIQSGEKLSDWSSNVLISAAEKQLALRSLDEYIKHSDNEGYDSVMIDIEKAKWLLSVVKKIEGVS